MTSKDDPFSNNSKNKQKVSKTYGSIRSRLRPKPSRPMDQISSNSKLEEEDENFKEIKSSNPSDGKSGPSKPSALPTKPFLRSRVNQKPTNLLLDRSNAQERTRKREIQSPKQNEKPKNSKETRTKKIKVHEDQEPRIDSSLFLEHSIDPLLDKRDYPMQQGMDEEITLRFNENEHEIALSSIPPILNHRRLRSNDDHQIENDLVSKRIRVATGSGSKEIKNQTESNKKKIVEKKEDLKIKGQESTKNKREKDQILKESPVMVSGQKFVPLDDDEYSDDPLRI